MSRRILHLRDEAQRNFLGWDTVVGVGLSRNEEEELIFLVKADSVEAREAIANWARQHKVRFQFKIVCKINAIA